MRRTFALALSLFAASLPAQAEVRTSGEAAQLATDVLCQRAHTSARRAAAVTDLELSYTAMKQASTEPVYYAFSDRTHGGWAVISADDRTLPVLCYSDRGRFDLLNANPAFRLWLRRYEEEIAHVSDENAYPSDSVCQPQVEPISPLLGEIAWYQETPYNNLCPIDQYDSTRVLSGCVASAMGQIMRMWKWPVHGTGEYTWTWQNYYVPTQVEHLYANFGETYYDWDNMREKYGEDPSSYTDQEADAVATLLYQLGVASQMEYGGYMAGGSYTWTDDMAACVEKYFSYTFDKFVTQCSKTIYMKSKNADCVVADDRCVFGISNAALIAYLNADLEAGRPVMMGADDPVLEAGHEFVCDGRDANGYFHINWGWEGDSNCYCPFTLLRPEGTTYAFNAHIDALIGLRPAVNDPVHLSGITAEVPQSITVRDGHLLIRKGDSCYDAMGRVVR